MKQVRIDTLLEPPQDAAAFQREWTTKGQCGHRSLLLELALFAGMVGPGLYAVSALCRFQPGLLAAFLIVLFGYALPHVAFLGRMERSWRSILRPGTSWISRGSIFAGAFLALGALSVVLDPNSGAYDAILIAATIAAILLAIYPGFLFAVLRAIPFWRSGILIPLFLAQALGGGLALLLLLGLLDSALWARRGPILAVNLAALAATGALIAAHIYFRHTAAAPAARIAVQRLLRGTYRTLFLGGVVLCGLAVPLLLIPLALLDVAAYLLVPVAALCQLAGILFFKYCLLNVGAYSPLYNPRLTPRRTAPGH